MRKLVSRILPGALLAATLAVSGCYVEGTAGTGPVEGEMVVETEPPPVRVEVQPVRPWADGIWMEGYWHWRGREYVWVPGRWERPRRGYYWEQHHYVRVGARWRYVPGHWRRH
jgi:hypothetical protein